MIKDVSIKRNRAAKKRRVSLVMLPSLFDDYVIFTNELFSFFSNDFQAASDYYLKAINPRAL